MKNDYIIIVWWAATLDRCGRFLNNTRQILSYVELLQLQPSPMGDRGYCFGWRLSSCHDWVIKLNLLILRCAFTQCFQILCDWLSSSCRQKWVRRRKSIMLLNSIFHTCNEKTTQTEHKIVTFVWIWIHNNRVCFKTTRGQTLIKFNFSCMCMYITEKPGSPTRVIYGRNIISVQFTKIHHIYIYICGSV